MRIPSGDLVPARRRRTHRFGRRRRRGPLLVALLLVGGVVGGVALVRRDDARRGPAAAAVCPTPAAPVAATPPAAPRLPAPSAVRLRVLNGTARDGLGSSVGAALTARGFVVSATGNAAGPLPGRSQVRFGPGGRPGATLLAGHVSGSTLVPVPSGPRGAIDLVLGGGFARLRTPAELAAALAPAPAPSPARDAAC